MKRFFIGIALVFFQWMFKLRYTVRYKGLDRIEEQLKNRSSGILFLSNHPAIFLDGMMVTCPLLKKYAVRTLIVEYMFFSPFISSVLKWIRALPVPNFGTGSNSMKLYRLHKVLKSVATGLKEKDNFLIYPAGMTKQTGKEVLGGTFAVHDILQQVPDCPIVLVRVEGLWGSRFSRAQNKGDSVDWASVLKKSFLDIFKAGIFFLPKREVEICFEVAHDVPKKGSRVELNHWLEDWFNAPFDKKTGEPLKLVSYSPWKYDVPDIESMAVHQVAHISPEIKEKVITWLSDALHRPKEDISVKDHLIADLAIDSLTLAELITYLESELNAPRILPQDLSTVASVLLAAQGELKTSQAPAKEWNKKEWFKKRRKKRAHIGANKTIVDHFLQTADRNLFCCIAADDKAGPLSYRKMKKSLYIASYHIQKLSGKRVGILLPDTIAAHVLTLACMMAGKTPVLLNWTVGSKSLKAMSELAGIDSVLTSFEFVDLLESVDLSSIREKILFLEEFKASFSFGVSAFLTLLSYLPYHCAKYSCLFSHWRHSTKEDEAVLLFTSGTESEPKGVLLSHSNILSNLDGALSSLSLYSTDRLMSILPPFHSFGFAVTGLMPLIAGVPVYFFPNPTDGGTIAEKMKDWRCTLLCAAPSFLKNILFQSRKEPLQELRLIVTGAEKATEDLFEMACLGAPLAKVVEGYGITECSPILTINESGERQNGVGRPLKNVTLLVVDPEDFSVHRKEGDDGMILAAGPNVFSGYLQPYLPSPFYVKDDTHWYVTGDIGHKTSNESLIITGRLKRFVKIGGEMIGLSAIEEGLSSLFEKENDEGPSFAVIALEDVLHVPKLVLIAKKAVSLGEANGELRRKGFSNLVRLDRVIQVEAIPVTATGKVSLRELALLAKNSA